MPGRPNSTIALRGLQAAADNPNQAHVQELRDIFDKWDSPNRPHANWPSDLSSNVEGTYKPENGWFINDVPTVRPAGGFRKDALVTGRPELHQAVNALQSIAPSLRGHADLITEGPTKAVMDDHDADQMELYKFGGTNLLGEWDRRKRDIFISPGTMRRDESTNPMRPNGLVETLGHEMSHSVGIPHGREMENVEGLLRMMIDRQAVEEGQSIEPNFVGGINWAEKKAIEALKGKR